MFWLRVGSFNGLDQTKPGGFWRRCLGGDIPGQHVLARVAAGICLDDLRELLWQHYDKRKRNKSLRPAWKGLFVLIFDGHECGATYRRCWPGALKRKVKTQDGEREQYYYRFVTAMLIHGKGQLLLDLEPQRPGQDEIAAATRLFLRLVERYPRAFDLVAGDALYLNPDLCRLMGRHGKYFLAVLKNENRDLIVDARALFCELEPSRWDAEGTHIEAWDVDAVTTWSQLGELVRVVRTIETTTVHRQLTKKDEVQKVEWMWATSLPTRQADTRGVVHLGHKRWTIENEGFNELVNEWEGDHIYHHDPNAIQACYLLLFLAYNIFHALLALNVKPQRRQRHTVRYFVRLIIADFYSKLSLPASAHPP